MASPKPEEGILDVFKFAANALVDAPSVDYDVTFSSDSAPSGSYESGERMERPALSESYTNSSGTYTQGSSSCGSSYDDSSVGIYRMEYHAFGNHTLESYDSDSYDDDSEQEHEDDSASRDGDSGDWQARDDEREASGRSTFSRIADALFMSKTPTQPVKSSRIVEAITSESVDADDSLLGDENISEAGDEDDSEAGDEDYADSPAGGGEEEEMKDISTHSALGRIADALPISKTPDFEVVEVTAEDSLRALRAISSDIKVAGEKGHRGHRRKVSMQSFDSAPLQNGVPSAKRDVQLRSPKKRLQIVATEPPKSTQMQPARKPPLTPRSTRSHTETPKSMAGLGKPPLKQDKQKARSSYSFRSSSPKSTGSSPGGGLALSRSSSFSFRLPSPKSAATSEPSTAKKTRFAESTEEFEVVSRFGADAYVLEDRDQGESEHRTSSSSDRQGRTSPAPVDDSTSWQWGSIVPSAHEVRDSPQRMLSPRSPSKTTAPRSQKKAFFKSERGTARVVPTSPRVAFTESEEEFKLFKLARKYQQDKPTAPESTQEILKKSDKDVTPKKKRFSKLFRSPSKQEHEEKHHAQDTVDTSMSGTKEDPAEPSTAIEAAEMITNLFKMSLQAGEENPAEPSQSEDIKTTNTESPKKSTKSSDADTAPTKNSSTKKKQRFSKLFQSPSKQEHEETHRATNTADTSKLAMKEVSKQELEPSTSTEAAGMIASLFRVSLQIEENPTETTNAESLNKSEKSSDADVTPMKNSSPKKKHRFSKLFKSSSKQEHEENHPAPNTADATKLPMMEESKQEPEGKKQSVPPSKSDTTEDPVEADTASEAVGMIASLFRMSLQSEENPIEPSKSQDVQTSISKTTDAAPVSTGDSSAKDVKNKKDTKASSASDDVDTEKKSRVKSLKKKVKGHTRSMSHMSFFRSSGKKDEEQKAAEQVPLKSAMKKKEEISTAPKVVEEKPAEIYDLTNWLWSPFLFPTDESGVEEPKDEPIVVVMGADEVKSDEVKKDKKKSVRSWAKGDKSSDRRSSSEDKPEMKQTEKKTKKEQLRQFIAKDRHSISEGIREMKQEKEKKTKKKQSRHFIANRGAKDSSRRQQNIEETIVIHDNLDNFVPSTSAWSQPKPSRDPPKAKRGSLDNFVPSTSAWRQPKPPPSPSKAAKSLLKHRIIPRTIRNGKKDKKMEEVMESSDDVNIVSFSHPMGKGQEMLLMTESVSKKLHKKSKSHSALVKSLYGGDDC